MSFTDKLDELMAEKGINKSILSKEAGIPYTTIAGFYTKGTDNIKLSTLAAHFDSEEYTEDELNEIRQFAEFVKGKRK